MDLKQKLNQFASSVFVVLLLAYSFLFVLKVRSPLFDYTFTFAFHVFMLLTFLFFISCLLFVLMSVIRLPGRLVKKGQGGFLERIFARLDSASASLGRYISFMAALYAFAIPVTALSLNFVVGAACIVCLSAITPLMKFVKNRPVQIVSAVLICAIAPAVIVRLVNGAAIPVAGIAVLAAAGGLAAWRPGFRFDFGRGTAWACFSGNRIGIVFAGFAAIAAYVMWAPVSGDGDINILASVSDSVGGGNDMIFTPDGRDIIYLDKKNVNVQLVSRDTLEVKSAFPAQKNPRDIVYDREKDLYYVVIHSLLANQLLVVRHEPFEKTASVTVPPDECSQINAVAVDYRHDRILIGCDSTGNVYYVNRTTLEAPDEPVSNPKPAGKGVVRIYVDEEADRAITIGCMIGPFINVIDLANWKTQSSHFTGYLAWEYVIDEKRNSMFVSVPLRSLVAEVSLEDFRVVNVLRAGFGARALAIDAAGRRLFVGNQVASTMDVFDLDTLEKVGHEYLPTPRYFLYAGEEGVLYAATSFGLMKVKI